MNKIFQISLITSVLATCGFAGEGDPVPVDVYGKLELNGGTDTADSTVRASGTLNVVADSTLESVLTLEQGAVMNVAAGVTLTNSGEININPAENAQVQKYINKTMYYEFDDGGTKVYCTDPEGSGGFVDENGSAASPTGTPTKSMHTTITGSPTGDGTIDIGRRQEHESVRLAGTYKILKSDTWQPGIGGTYEDIGINGEYYVYESGAMTILSPVSVDVDNITLKHNSTDLGDPTKVLIRGYADQSFYVSPSENHLVRLSDCTPTWAEVSNVSSAMVQEGGRITSDTATASYIRQGAATLDSDETNLTEKLTGITNQFVLSSAKSTGWSENWIKNLPTIKYTDDESTEHVFDKTGTADEIATDPEAYLNGFGIYPNAVNDSSTTAMELLEEKTVSDAIKIPAASTIAVDVDATVSANLHNIGESSATTAFSGEGVLTLSGNNQYLGGEVSFNKVAISGQNSIPGGDVTVNTSLQVSSDADLTGTVTMSKGSTFSVDEGKSLKVFGTLTLE